MIVVTSQEEEEEDFFEWFSIQSWMVFNTVMNGFQYSCEWFSIQSWMVFNTVVNGFQYSREWFSIQSWMVFNTVMNGFQYSHEWFSIQSWMVFNTVVNGFQYSHEWFSIQSCKLIRLIPYTQQMSIRLHFVFPEPELPIFILLCTAWVSESSEHCQRNKVLWLNCSDQRVQQGGLEQFVPDISVN